MTTSRLILRHLAFTGPHRPLAEVVWADGLNLLYGASNTGKSFTLKSINFMLGGTKPLLDFKERNGYEVVLLGFTISGAGDFTLARSISGGGYRLHTGLVKRDDPTAPVKELLIKASGKRESLSQFLLSQLNLSGKRIAKNSSGEKENLSFRDLAAIALVDETSIQSERSPVETDLGPVALTKERSVFRLLLTGSDDSAITTVLDPKSFATSKAARIEVVEDLTREVEARLVAEFGAEDDLNVRLGKIDATLTDAERKMSAATVSIRALLDTKRTLAGEISDAEDRYDAIQAHVSRFAQLDLVYASDIGRLIGLEEAGFLLAGEHSRACDFCGAPPEAQIRDLTADIEGVRAAAVVEAEKVARHRDDLAVTIRELSEEEEAINNSLPTLRLKLEQMEDSIRSATPILRAAQVELHEHIAARAQVQEGLLLYEQRRRYANLLEELSELKKPTKDEKPSLTPPKLAVHEFAQTVSEVLKKWNFPGNLAVHFDERSYDLVIDGKLRISNGKGVRAVTHAAFKVALLIYCHRKGLPHPGFVVLDTPLLTYRDPMKNPAAGELTKDEAELAQTSLKESFFNHLSSLSAIAQFVVLENIDPPPGIAEIAHVETYFGANGGGRTGLFPM